MNRRGKMKPNFSSVKSEISEIPTHGIPSINHFDDSTEAKENNVDLVVICSHVLFEKKNQSMFANIDNQTNVHITKPWNHATLVSNLRGLPRGVK